MAEPLLERELPHSVFVVGGGARPATGLPKLPRVVAPEYLEVSKNGGLARLHPKGVRVDVFSASDNLREAVRYLLTEGLPGVDAPVTVWADTRDGKSQLQLSPVGPEWLNSVFGVAKTSLDKFSTTDREEQFGPESQFEAVLTGHLPTTFGTMFKVLEEAKAKLTYLLPRPLGLLNSACECPLTFCVAPAEHTSAEDVLAALRRRLPWGNKVHRNNSSKKSW